MVIAEVVTLLLYMVSMVFLPEYFGTSASLKWLRTKPLTTTTDLTFVISTRFAWKVAVIVAVSALPLYIIKFIKSRVAPAAYSKLL